MIKFDLHIHSSESRYKEEVGIVDLSTVDNVNILLSKLNEHNVALFSITDHNRFNVELYNKIDSILSGQNDRYHNVQTVLAGVEFDVKFDDALSKCHIIAIFDAKNNPINYKKIKDTLDNNLLTDKEAVYSKEKFEDILIKIDLNTILIASQRKSINNHNGRHNSLSDAVSDVEEVIKIGYINALEFQKPKVEGILINNLNDIPSHITLLSGSDCHQWSCYPYHDENNKNLEFYHSKVKILPTFKGLLMAITSPQTRFNCRENTNLVHIDGIILNEQSIPFNNGINAIIGENGSGKSTILELLNNKVTKTHVKRIVLDNKLEVSNNVDLSKVKYIKQGDIITKFNENKLFASESEENFDQLDDSKFINSYNIFAESLHKNIKLNILKNEKISSLVNQYIEYKSELSEKNYYVNVNCPKDFGIANNAHENPLKDIASIYEKLENLKQNDYFQEYKDNLNKALEELKFVYRSIHYKWIKIDYEARVKNIMYSCFKDYSRKVSEKSSAKDQEIQEYQNKKQQFIDAVVETIKISISEDSWQAEPPPLTGVTKRLIKGFHFNREAAYNNISMSEDFYKKMFVKGYDNLEKLKTINTNEEFSNAIRNCTSIVDIEGKWKESYSKFISEAIKTHDYITDVEEKKIGNTLGEMSLSYYKYYTQDNENWNILIIDQPEDNISNNNISKRLISYMNSIRNEKQLIFVTHNPLLVVNLDVDNVMFVQNNSGELSIKSGPLEYENEEVNILDIIAENMDGGKDSIEKRLKVYGKGE